jgi:hypothetical protein
MPPKLRTLRAELARAGWQIDHQTGSHQIWKHPLLPGDVVNLAGNDGADAHRYQERDVRAAIERARKAAQGRQP